MKKKHQYLLFFFWMALLADCLLIFQETHEYRWVTKGALMPILLLFFVANAPRRHHLPSRTMVILALLLAWAGDITLLFQGEKYFIAGLILFLTMHLVYIVYFWRIQPPFKGNPGQFFFFPFLLVLAVDLILGFKLFPLAGDLGAPLMAYMAVISFMFILACNVLANKKSKSLAWPYFIPGAALFIVSDALLGFNMFLWQDALLALPVMLTYGYAQHLLVNGFVKHVKGRVV